MCLLRSMKVLNNQPYAIFIKAKSIPGILQTHYLVKHKHNLKRWAMLCLLESICIHICGALIVPPKEQLRNPPTCDAFASK